MQQSICSRKPNPDTLKKINDVSIEFYFGVSSEISKMWGGSYQEILNGIQEVHIDELKEIRRLFGV